LKSDVILSDRTGGGEKRSEIGICRSGAVISEPFRLYFHLHLFPVCFFFHYFRSSLIELRLFSRLRVFRNMLHLQLMIAILMVVIIRLILYVDLIFTDRMSAAHTMPEGKTINTMVSNSGAFSSSSSNIDSTFRWSSAR
jgi:hypothetical protein